MKTVRLSAPAAVARLARFVRDDRRNIFPLVRALDDQVGSHAEDFFFDRRIDVAEQQHTSWQFFYTLTGGWRRVRRAALELRERERADLALLAIAVAQIGGLRSHHPGGQPSVVEPETGSPRGIDAGVQRDELLAMLGLLGRDEAWLDAALSTLQSRRNVTESDGRIRCSHLQAAINTVAWMLHPPAWNPPPLEPPVVVPPISSSTNTGPRRRLARKAQPVEPPPLARAEMRADQDSACALIELVLDSPDTPLRGCWWFVGHHLSGDSRRVLEQRGVLSKERYEYLLARALATPPDGGWARPGSWGG